MNPVACLWLSLAFLMMAVLSHAAFRRVFPKIGSVGAYLIVGSGLGAVLGMLCWRLFGPDIRSLAVLLVYALGCELYIFMFTMVSSSISASILLTLQSASMNDSELSRAMRGQDMVFRRLEKLVASGLLRQEEDQYFITGKGLRLIRSFRRLRLFFGHP